MDVCLLWPVMVRFHFQPWDAQRSTLQRLGTWVPKLHIHSLSSYDLVHFAFHRNTLTYHIPCSNVQQRSFKGQNNEPYQSQRLIFISPSQNYDSISLLKYLCPERIPLSEPGICDDGCGISGQHMFAYPRLPRKASSVPSHEREPSSATATQIGVARHWKLLRLSPTSSCIIHRHSASSLWGIEQLQLQLPPRAWREVSLSHPASADGCTWID